MFLHNSDDGDVDNNNIIMDMIVTWYSRRVVKCSLQELKSVTFFCWSLDKSKWFHTSNATLLVHVNMLKMTSKITIVVENY